MKTQVIGLFFVVLLFTLQCPGTCSFGTRRQIQVRDQSEGPEGLSDLVKTVASLIVETIQLLFRGGSTKDVTTALREILTKIPKTVSVAGLAKNLVPIIGPTLADVVQEISPAIQKLISVILTGSSGTGDKNQAENAEVGSAELNFQ